MPPWTLDGLMPLNAAPPLEWQVARLFLVLVMDEARRSGRGLTRGRGHGRRGGGWRLEHIGEHRVHPLHGDHPLLPADCGLSGIALAAFSCWITVRPLLERMIDRPDLPPRRAGVLVLRGAGDVSTSSTSSPRTLSNHRPLSSPHALLPCR